MNRRFYLWVGLLLIAPGVRAEFHAGDQTVAGDFGLTSPQSDLDLTDVGGGKGQAGAAGPVGGFQYLYHVNPRFGFGPDVQFLRTGDSESSTLIPHGLTKVDYRSTVFLAMARFNLATTGAVIPYLSAGAGLHSTTFNLKSRPAAGYSWFDTGTQEERTLISDKESGIAFALGAGLDVYLTKAIFLGVEGRLTHLGDATYNSTVNTSFSTTLAGIKGSFSQLNVLARLGYRFGAGGEAASDADAAAPPPASVSVSTAALVSMTCPFPVSSNQKVHVHLKSGKTTGGKVISCDAELKIRTGIFIWTYPIDTVANIDVDR